MKPTLFLSYLVLFTSNIFAQEPLNSCGAFDNGPIFVQQAITEIPIDIYTIGSDNLADNPLTEVKLRLSHYWIGDVAISLCAPDGTEFLLVGDDDNNFNGCGQAGNGYFDLSIVRGNFNPLTNGQNYYQICPGGYCEGEYTVFFPYSGGSFYSDILDAEACPTGDLDNFNQTGGFITGTWTLRIACVCALELGNNFFIEGCELVFENQEEVYCIDEELVGNYEPVSLNACLGESLTMSSDLPNWATRWTFSNGDIVETDGNVLETTLDNYAEYYTVEASSVNPFGNFNSTQVFSLFPSHCEDLFIEVGTLAQGNLCFGGSIANVELCSGGRTDFEFSVSDNETCLNFTPADYECETVCVRYIEDDIPHDVTIEICVVQDLEEEIPFDIPNGILAAPELSISPNPTSDILKYSFQKKRMRTVRIINIFGKILYQKETEALSNRIDVSEYPAGVYWFVCGEESRKFVKR